MLPRDYFKKMDRAALFSSAALVAFGLIFLYTMSAAPGARGNQGVYFRHQAAWLTIALPAGALFMAFDYRLWARVSWAAYIVNIALLGALLLFGGATRGAESWFSLGPVKFQPSEAAKILFIITFAHFLAAHSSELNKPAVLGLAFLQFAVPFTLIVLQPDMGTALVYVALFFGMLFTAGADALRMAAAITVFGGAAALAAPLFLKSYQIARLTTFLHPARDAGGSGWQLSQSKIAIGSGGIFGRGFLHGTQASLGFLPEARTDFIFSAICEQVGFIGGAAVILLFAVYLFRIVRIASLSEDLFATYIATGIFCMVAFQAVVNLGMAVGMMPITGIPLPFVSYGGSSLLTHCAAAGLALNISIRRKKITFV